MRLDFDPTSLDDYRRFLAVRQCPVYHFEGWQAVVPDEYAERLGVKLQPERPVPYKPASGLFDYQRSIAAMAIRKRKFAVFADCGLGKTFILLEFARHAMLDGGGIGDQVCLCIGRPFGGLPGSVSLDVVLGLVVAIPAYLFYAFLSARSRSIMHDLERAGVEIVNLIEDAKSADNIVEFRQPSEETQARGRSRKTHS